MGAGWLRSPPPNLKSASRPPCAAHLVRLTVVAADRFRDETLEHRLEFRDKEMVLYEMWSHLRPRKRHDAHKQLDQYDCQVPPYKVPELTQVLKPYGS